MDNENIISKLNEIIDDNAKTLVGILLKRLDVLNGEELSSEKKNSLYKSLVKEHIYENARYLKKLLKANLETGTIIFKPKAE